MWVTAEIADKIAEMLKEDWSEELNRAGVTANFVANYVDENLDDNLLQQFITEAASFGEFECKKCQEFFNMHEMAWVPIRLSRKECSEPGVCRKCVAKEVSLCG